MLILGVQPTFHDAAAAVFEDYTLKAAVQLERLTRVKGDGNGVPWACIDEVLAIAGATRRDVDAVAIGRMALPYKYFTHFRGARALREWYRTRFQDSPDRSVGREMLRAQTLDERRIVDVDAFRRDAGFRPDTAVYFFNHHRSHALPALFYTGWDDALLVTADAGGDMLNYSHTHFADGALTVVYGGDEHLLAPIAVDSVGRAYGFATEALGFRSLRHEGKVTGLAAAGAPVLADAMRARFRVLDSGRIVSDFPRYRDMGEFIVGLRNGVSREDYAASIQALLEGVMLDSVRTLLARHPARRLGVAGGVFANVKLNRTLAESLPLDEIFVFPPMGDEGLAVGGVLAYLLDRDGMERWLAQRRPLTDMYLGRDFGDAGAAFAAMPQLRRLAEPPVEGAVARLAAGGIGAIYAGRMEFGPRALGARSILASPAKRETHDELNRRLSRSEFMPFAPVIPAARAAAVFDVGPLNRYAARFMTITCDVRPEWRARIPAVVHVDGSARPQLIEREPNPLYFDIVEGFTRVTGLPALVNTSFNVHEEPIVNTPAECAQALTDGRIDFVATGGGLFVRA